MQIALWILVSLVFIGSVLMFIPSVMSLGAPKYVPKNRKEYWAAKVSSTFLVLMMAYPFVFTAAVFAYRLFSIPVVEVLTVYVVLLGILFCMWSKGDKANAVS